MLNFHIFAVRASLKLWKVPWRVVGPELCSQNVILTGGREGERGTHTHMHTHADTAILCPNRNPSTFSLRSQRKLAHPCKKCKHKQRHQFITCHFTGYNTDTENKHIQRNIFLVSLLFFFPEHIHHRVTLSDRTAIQAPTSGHPGDHYRTAEQFSVNRCCPLVSN